MIVVAIQEATVADQTANTCEGCGYRHLNKDVGLNFCGSWMANYVWKEATGTDTWGPDKLILPESPACKEFSPRRKAAKVEQEPMPPELLKAFRDLPRAPIGPPHFACYGRWFCDVCGEYDGFLADWDEFYGEHENCYRKLLS